MSMDYRILRIILGGVLLLVAAFALGTRLAEWDQERVQPEPPPAEMEDGKKPSLSANAGLGLTHFGMRGLPTCSLNGTRGPGDVRS